jgi:hypothetical protein
VSTDEHERDLWRPPSPPERRTARDWLDECRQTLDRTKPKDQDAA